MWQWSNSKRNMHCPTEGCSYTRRSPFYMGVVQTCVCPEHNVDLVRTKPTDTDSKPAVNQRTGKIRRHS